MSLAERALELLGTLELERLPDAILARAAEVARADAAAVWVADDQGQLVLRGWRGGVDREALRGRLDPRQGELADAFERGGALAAAGAAGPALRLPLAAEGERVGLLVLERPRGGRFGPDDVAAAEGLARAAGLALHNARRFQALERGTLRDRDSGAYHLAYLVDYAGKEFYKARRYGRSFSLAILSVEHVDELRRAAGAEAMRAAARGVVAATSRVVRDGDVLARVSDREFFVLLPETDHFGALMFVRRAAGEIRREPAVVAMDARGGPLAVAMGAATFPGDGTDFDELREACRARQAEHRASLVHRLDRDLGPAAFWEAADALLGTAPLGASPSARLPSDPELVELIQREVAREVARDPRARGVVYAAVAGDPVRSPVVAALPALQGAARAGDTAARVVLLGGRGQELPGHPLVSHVPLQGDRRLEARPFLLYLAEHAAYGLLQGAGGELFHTSDAPLVDALVSRLQALYELQPL